jgi:tRNA(Arg) A34 adenosine deaminase TadA
MHKINYQLTQPIRKPYDTYDYVEETLSNNDTSFLAATAKIALTSDYRFRMAALLVKSGRVLGGDTNLARITPDTPPNRVSTHAEIRVLKNTKNTKGATLYVARLKSKDEHGLARPCAWCMSAILEHEISRVVFTTNDSFGSSFYTDMVSWRI